MPERISSMLAHDSGQNVQPRFSPWRAPYPYPHNLEVDRQFLSREPSVQVKSQRFRFLDILVGRMHASVSSDGLRDSRLGWPLNRTVRFTHTDLGVAKCRVGWPA